MLGSTVATEGPGGAVPPFRITQNTVCGTSRNNKTTTDNKGKRNNYVQTFLLGRFLDSSQNCWQPTATHKFDAIFRLINTPLRMCRG